jgi:hypothetical protein
MEIVMTKFRRDSKGSLETSLKDALGETRKRFNNWISINITSKKKKKKRSQAWWRTPLIPTLGRQRQADF